MRNPSPILVLSNAASKPADVSVSACRKLEYLSSLGEPNVRLHLPRFVKRLAYLPPRLLDLLELAAFVFAADRLASRGARDAIEFEPWARSFHFVQRVRDFQFWSRPDVASALSSLLEFSTGDACWKFEFQPGHETDPTSLFDSKEFAVDSAIDAEVMLFSGGLDSLVGALSELSSGSHPVLLIRHQSGQPGTIRTQQKLVEALAKRFPERALDYSFECGLKKIHAYEESQRTRAFLYCAIGYVLAKSYRKRRLLVHENGFTSLNFPRRQDMLNARASRTTHPKTMKLLKEFLCLVEDGDFDINLPFGDMTKTDVVGRLRDLGHQDLLTSTVSCSRTFHRLGPHTHCGVCSQCVDRRFAIYAAGLNEMGDDGLYATNFLKEKIEDPEGRTVLIDYVRQASEFAGCGEDEFYTRKLSELTDVMDAFEDESEEKVVARVWQLCQRQGLQVLAAIKRIRETYDNPYAAIVPGSFVEIISERAYLETPVEFLVKAISNRLSRAIPKAFRRNLPKNEADFNDKVEAILSSDEDKLRREHPAVPFALGHSVPDFSSASPALFVESKYIRKGTPPSKVSEGIAADLKKYPLQSHKLFIVYDPGRAISDDEAFAAGFKASDCTLFIIR